MPGGRCVSITGSLLRGSGQGGPVYLSFVEIVAAARAVFPIALAIGVFIVN